MEMNEDGLMEVISFATIEVTFSEALIEDEMMYLMDKFRDNDMDVVFNAHQRIMLIASDDLEVVLNLIVKYGFGQIIGLIRVIQEFEPQWDELIGATLQ